MKPENTSKNPQPHWLFGQSSNAIEAQEARGQQELVRSEVLPTERLDQCRALLESWGFQIGEPFADDRLFTPVTLPTGWSKKPTDHSMWSTVVDDKGRNRLSLFYKAAFYDRRAFTNVERRYVDDYDAGTLIDNATGEVLFTAPAKLDANEHEDRRARNEAVVSWATDRFGAGWNSPERWNDV